VRVGADADFGAAPDEMSGITRHARNCMCVCVA
jgi:hypothetical protein